MISEAELREKLKAWSREYGYGGGFGSEYQENLLQKLIDHKGFVPTSRGYVGIPINTIGDEVEDAIRMMETMPAEAGDENVCFKAAKAIRAYYVLPHAWPEEDRLKWMRGIGLPMSRHTFYRFVQVGRAFLLGYLRASNQEVA